MTDMSISGASMRMLTLDAMMSPISDDDPVGPDLEYDAEFAALDRVAVGKPERRMGDEIIAAEEPDWHKVAAQCERLLSRSKDLRVAVHLARASLERNGVEGLSFGLALIAELLERYWLEVHPRLEIDGDFDPAYRANSLSPLAAMYANPELGIPGLVDRLRRTTLFRSRLLGAYCYRDYLVARGEITASAADEESEGVDVPDLARLQAALKDSDPADVQRVAEAVDAAGASVGRIQTLFDERLDEDGGLNLGLLRDTLDRIRSIFADLDGRQVPEGGVARPGVGVNPSTSVSGQGGINSPGVIRGSAEPAALGRISTREDVIAALERVCVYYENNEPSSPVPILLRRAQRLARMNFMEILHDMTPSGLEEARIISGVRVEVDE